MSVGTGVEQQLQAKLVELQSSLMDVAGVLVASSDGLAMAHTMPGGIDSNRVAAMAATALGLGKRISGTLTIGNFEEATIKASDGSIYLYMIGQVGSLAIMTSGQANVGLINLEARRAVRELAGIIG